MNTLKKNHSNNFFNGLNPFIILIIFLLTLSGAIYLFSPKERVLISNLKWQQEITELGVGSPRLFDMNRDGVMDIFIGSGFEWSEKGLSSMKLINGRSGRVLWSTEVPESAYGTPILVDITGDQLPDLPVTGRFSDLWMLHGRTGEILWKLSEKNPEMALLPCNFNSPVPIPDIDGDGIVDFVSIQGGLANGSSHISIYNADTDELLLNTYRRTTLEAALNKLLKSSDQDEFNFKVCRGDNCEIKTVERNIFIRYSFDVYMSKLLQNQEGPGGRVYLISSKSGKIIQSYPVPNDRESWSVPILHKIGSEMVLIYGSGGERKNGFLQAQNLMTGDVIWSIETTNKGIISSPILFQDGDESMVVTNTMNGEIMKVNATTGDIIWRQSVSSDYETYSSPLIYQSASGTDVVSLFSYGVWPKYNFTALFVFDGKTGKQKFREQIGFCFGASSPILADINGDLSEDIVLVSCTDRQPRLMAFDKDYKSIFTQALKSGGYATPIIEDIDKNGQLDIIIPRFHFLDRYEFAAKKSHNDPLNWNQYRGKYWIGQLIR